MKLLLTICAAFAGAYLGLRYKLPAGALVGAMLSTMAFNLVFGMAYMPVGLKFYTQLATGAYIGAKITRDDALSMRQIVKPSLILSLVLLLFTTGVGWVICHVTRLTAATALFAIAPAGITDMTLASMDFDAEPSVVALVQTVRVISTVCLMPLVIRRLARTRRADPFVKPPAKSGQKKRSGKDLAVTLLIALICGAAGKRAGIPGGVIAFAMAGCAMYNIWCGKGYMPLRLRQFIQVFAGALIGSTVGRQEFFQMLEIYNVVIIAVVSFLALDLVAASLIAKWTDMDFITALFACAPGGLTDMTLIAESMGADSVKIAGIHMIRLVSVVAFYPSVIHLLVAGIG